MRVIMRLAAVAFPIAILTAMAPATASQVAKQHSGRPYCHHRLFTVKMDKRAANLIYRGTHTVTRHNTRVLGQIERCQRNPAAQRFVRWYNHHLAATHAQRIYDVNHPWNSGWFTEYFPGGGGQEGGTSYSCGGSYAYGDMVVANDQLACGTKVQLEENGRTADVVVEDRFGAGHPAGNFDLTPAVADQLGCSCSEPGSWRLR